MRQSTWFRHYLIVLYINNIALGRHGGSQVVCKEAWVGCELYVREAEWARVVMRKGKMKSNCMEIWRTDWDCYVGKGGWVLELCMREEVLESVWRRMNIQDLCWGKGRLKFILEEGWAIYDLCVKKGGLARSIVWGRMGGLGIVYKGGWVAEYLAWGSYSWPGCVLGMVVES